MVLSHLSASWSRDGTIPCLRTRKNPGTPFLPCLRYWRYVLWENAPLLEKVDNRTEQDPDYVLDVVKAQQNPILWFFNCYLRSVRFCIVLLQLFLLNNEGYFCCNLINIQSNRAQSRSVSTANPFGISSKCITPSLFNHWFLFLELLR